VRRPYMVLREIAKERIPGGRVIVSQATMLYPDGTEKPYKLPWWDGVVKTVQRGY